MGRNCQQICKTSHTHKLNRSENIPRSFRGGGYFLNILKTLNRRRPLVSAKLYCWMTEVHVYVNFFLRVVM